MRPCGDCKACCEGHLAAIVHGTKMGPNPCVFLCGHCTIYELRPQLCKNYQCLWSQNILSEEHRPDKTGILVSVENLKGWQYLKIIKTREIFNQSGFDEIIKFAKDHKTPYMIINCDLTNEMHGPEKFIKIYNK